MSIRKKEAISNPSYYYMLHRKTKDVNLHLFIWNRWGSNMSDRNRFSSRDLQLQLLHTHTEIQMRVNESLFHKLFLFYDHQWHQPTKGTKKLINQPLCLTSKSVKQLNLNSQTLPGWVWHSSHIPLCTGEQWERRLCGQRCRDGPWPGRLSLRIGF